ncbi:hypothetical protein NDN13_09425 [Acinetobacter sp. C32I]|uniref:hypothetical protein n=1 Tax=Acinetobacter sp. C32I TaxID=2950074 RepID=UPI0020375015|nr:hypothetical protein [Acinetobacter sp. C32I]USA55382.1 hypothetical protein NDN13_09425 [Acinetobacter sp. C32I]
MKNKVAVILAPVMPVWDNGDFCKDLKTILLDLNYEVHIIDTVNEITSCAPKVIIDSLKNKLNEEIKSPFILIGFAMGGALVQVISTQIDNVIGAISINGPGFADEDLKLKLSNLVNLLNQRELTLAMDELHKLVLPKNILYHIPPMHIDKELQENAISRMKLGFKLLLNLDARNIIPNFKHNFLSVVGELSQLASINNQVIVHSPHFQYRLVNKAGMRPWNDNPMDCNKILKEWLSTYE